MVQESRDSRRAILDAAREGFASKGFYGTSMDYIVKKTGLSKGAIYWYFPGKWEMYKSVVSEEAERIKNIIIPSDIKTVSSGGVDFFVSRGERLIDALAADPLCRLLFVHLTLEAMRGRDEMVEFITSLRASIMEDVVGVFEVLFPADSLLQHGISHREIVNMFISILHGIIMNLELTVGCEEAKNNWRFLSQRILGGKSHES